MKIILSTLVRYDEDIIDLFIDNNSKFVDHIYIMLHNPFERIEKIIDHYISQGKKITKIIINEKNFNQEKFVNSFMDSEYYNDENADIWMHLDADEIIISLDELINVYDEYGKGTIAKTPWYEACFFGDDQAIDVAYKRDGSSNKEIYIRDPQIDSDIKVSWGQHNIFRKSGKPIKKINLKNPLFLHIPYRSQNQMLRKALIWYTNSLNANPNNLLISDENSSNPYMRKLYTSFKENNFSYDELIHTKFAFWRSKDELLSDIGTKKLSDLCQFSKIEIKNQITNENIIEALIENYETTITNVIHERKAITRKRNFFFKK